MSFDQVEVGSESSSNPVNNGLLAEARRLSYGSSPGHADSQISSLAQAANEAACASDVRQADGAALSKLPVCRTAPSNSEFSSALIQSTKQPGAVERLNNMDKDSAWWVLGEATLGNVMLGAAARGLLFPPLKVVPRAALELGRIPVKTSIVLGLVGLAALGRTIYNYARFEEER